jgi:UDP-3-O-[3-hydroxymyristoyl] glucosamine N-acyltransferase
MKKTLQEIADIVGGRIAGDAAIEIEGLDNIAGAGAGD